MNPHSTRLTRLNQRQRNRIRLGLILLLVLLLLIAGRLVLVQGFNAGGTAQAAVAQRSIEQKLAASRGQITDSNGKVLAQTVLRYDIVADQVNNGEAQEFERLDTESNTTQKVSRDQGIQELAQALGMSETNVRRAVTGDARYSVVAKQVPPDVEQKVAELRIPGIAAQAAPQRTYPMGQVGGNVVGFINQDGTGSGVEYTYKSDLEGSDGKRIYQKGKDGIVIPQAPVDITPAVDGKNIKLTINADLQFAAQQAITKQVKDLQAAWGNILVIEAKTGRIIVMAEDTTVDPNKPGATPAEVRDSSRAIKAAVEPGSTEKAVTAAAAINEGKVTPDTKMVIPPTLTVNGQTFKDAYTHGQLNTTFTGTFVKSLNTGTVMVGSELSKQQRYDYLNSFGVGQKTGIKLAGESKGSLAQPNTWDDRTQYTVLFGQGVSQTPLQTAMIYQTIANNGVRVTPQIVDSVIEPDGTERKIAPEPVAEVISPESSQQVRDMLETLVTSGQYKTDPIPGYRSGGKTGTAESPADGSFNGFTASYASMAPMEDPQYVALVTVQHPQTNIFGGSQIEVANELMAQVLRQKGVPPSTTPPVRLQTEY